MENKINFKCEGFLLEGLISDNHSEKAVIITHPHPLYGGDMNNPVVSTIKDAYLSCGYKTLRFNFRGTGGSSGFHDDGVGEVNDVKAAIDYLKESGLKNIELAGYSFGSYVNSNVDYKFNRIIMVAPPLDFIKFKSDIKLPELKLVVAGKNDSFAKTDSVEKEVYKWNKNTKIVFLENCDHFFSSSLDKLKEIIVQELK